MKFIRKITTGLFLTLALFFFLVYLFIQINGEQFLKEILSEGFDRPVEIDHLIYIPPLGIRADGVTFGEDMSAGKVVVFFSPDAPFVFKKGQVNISSVFLENPSVSLRTKEDDSENETAITPEEKKKDSKKWTVNIRELTIQNGSIKRPEKWHLGEISLLAKELRLSSDIMSLYFNGAGRVIDGNSMFADKTVDSFGSLDLINKDMDSEFTFKGDDGEILLKAKTVSDNNIMRVEGNIDIKKLLEAKKAGGEGGGFSFGDKAIEALSFFGVKLNTNFSFETKMDDFQIDKIAVFGNMIK